MTASPRGDGSEAPVGKVAVPKSGYDTGKKSFRDRLGDGLPRGDASETPLGRVAVTKTGQKNPAPRGDVAEVPLEGVAVPKNGLKTPFATRGCP